MRHREYEPLSPKRTAIFWERVVKSENPDDCWEWTGYRFKSTGYGGFTRKCVGENKWQPDTAHRVAYLLSVGPIPPGLVIDHLCRNRGCVNPGHMEVVTRGENVLRGESLSAKQARQTHCKNGHEFTEENTYRKPSDNRRECRICQRAREAARRPRKKAA